MKRSLMVFTAIAALVGPALAPASAMAQDHGRRGDARQSRGDRDDGGDRGASAPAQRPSLNVEHRAPSRPAQDRSAPDRNDRPDRSNGHGAAARPSSAQPAQSRPTRPTQSRPDRPTQSRPDSGGRPRGDRPGQNNNQTRPDRNGSWNSNGQNRPDRNGGDRDDRPGQNGSQSRPDRNGSNNGGWNSNRGRPDQNGQWNRGNDNRDRSYGNFRRNWDSNQWRNNWNRSHRSDWWRNDNRFRGFSGIRFGFYFAPGYGYYNVPSSYYGRQYYEGQYLPSVFWRYQLNDYRTYGLGFPPPGTQWVYVDNAIYLIDSADGYIIEVVRDAWNW